MCALLQLCHCPIFAPDACPELLEHALLARLPIPPATILQHAIEFLLCLPSALFDS